MTKTSSGDANDSRRWREHLNSIVSIALLVAAVTVTWSTLKKPKPPSRVEPKVPSSLQSTQGVPLKGAPTASAVLIEYSDFQCPFCRKFATDILPTLEAKYIETGQLLFAFGIIPSRRVILSHARPPKQPPVLSVRTGSGRRMLSYSRSTRRLGLRACSLPLPRPTSM